MKRSEEGIDKEEKLLNLTALTEETLNDENNKQKLKKLKKGEEASSKEVELLKIRVWKTLPYLFRKSKKTFPF